MSPMSTMRQMAAHHKNYLFRSLENPTFCTAMRSVSSETQSPSTAVPCGQKAYSNFDIIKATTPKMPVDVTIFCLSVSSISYVRALG